MSRNCWDRFEAGSGLWKVLLWSSTTVRTHLYHSLPGTQVIQGIPSLFCHDLFQRLWILEQWAGLQQWARQQPWKRLSGILRVVNFVIENNSFYTYISVVSRYSATVQTFISTIHLQFCLRQGLKKWKELPFNRGKGVRWAAKKWVG